MKRAYFACLFLGLMTTFLLSQSRVASPTTASQADPKAQARILDSYGKLPLSFEANHGQTDAQVKFLSRTSGYTLFLTGDEAVLALNGKKVDAKNGKVVVADLKFQFDVAAPKAGAVLRMKLRNANPAAKVIGMDELAGINNYFIGNDPKRWRTNVPTYAKVKYEGIYRGIDLVYYGNQRQLEYDFVVAPGADPHCITFDVRGAKQIRQGGHDEIVFKVGEGEIRWHRPIVYQEKDGERQEIVAHYAISAANRFGFAIAKYDLSRPLYIDPLIYSTYLGGGGYDWGYSIAVDSTGNAYVGGQTTSRNFPTTPGAFQTTYSSGYEAFVTKFNPTGSALVYSTYLGSNATNAVYGVATDGSGNAYVVGTTSSRDFPVTSGAFQTNYGGPETDSDAFVTKINSSGSALIYSTFLGGSGDVQSQGESQEGAGIALDSAGDVYVTGTTNAPNFPVTMGAFQTTCDKCDLGHLAAFVSEFNPTGSALVYSTYLGGSGVDFGFGIAVDTSGDAFVTGSTESLDFPVTDGAFQTACGGTCLGSAFVSKLNPTGSALIYSTYLGGSGQDQGNGIAVDGSGIAYVTGYTTSTNFPVTPGAFQTTCGNPSSCQNAYVAKLNPMGSNLVYATFLGGIGGDGGQGIAVDSAGNAYVTGITASPDFPTTPGAFQTTCNHGKSCYGDAFITKLNPTGSALVYSTYLGGKSTEVGYGIALDTAGDAFVTGITYSTNFPVTPGAFQLRCVKQERQCWDAFVTKVSLPLAATTTTLTSFPNPSNHGQVVTFTALVTSGSTAPPDGETVSFVNGKAVLGTGSLRQGSAAFSTSTLKVGTASVTAVYGGDANFGGSTSNTVKQVVQKTD